MTPASQPWIYVFLLAVALPLDALAASAPGGTSSGPPAQALSQPTWALEVPRLDQVGGLLAFLERAGRSTALLRPENLLPDLFPLLQLNPTRPDSLMGSGVDPRGPLVFSERANAQMVCVQLLDPVAFQRRAEAALLMLGEPWSQRQGAVRVVGARHQGKRVKGYALRGREACGVMGAQGSEAPWQEAVSALGRPIAREGAARVWIPRGSAWLRGTAVQLQAEGVALRLTWPRIRPHDRSPFPDRIPSGLAFFRGNLEPQTLAVRFEPDLLALCSACPRKAVQAVLQLLAEISTGELMFRLEGLRPRPDFSTRAGQLRALQFAAALGVSGGEAARGRFGRLAIAAGARAVEQGWVLPVDGGELALRWEEGVLWLSTDGPALAQLQRSPPQPGGAPPGAYFRLDGAAASRALARLSLFDLLRRPELAPLAAASVQLGSLLEATTDIAWVLQSSTDGVTPFSMTWRLVP